NRPPANPPSFFLSGSRPGSRSGSWKTASFRSRSGMTTGADGSAAGRAARGGGGAWAGRRLSGGWPAGAPGEGGRPELSRPRRAPGPRLGDARERPAGGRRGAPAQPRPLIGPAYRGAAEGGAGRPLRDLGGDPGAQLVQQRQDLLLGLWADRGTPVAPAAGRGL